MAGLDRHRAADVEIEPFPEIEARIGENPARFLDRELVERGPKHTTTSWRELFLARVRGIGKIAVANTWIEVERELAVRQERAPRESVKQVLRARVNYLVENGETHLQDLSIEELHSLSEDHTISDEGDEVGPVWQHTPCGSPDVERESSMAWFCRNCRQRTNRVEEVDDDELQDEPELIADGGFEESDRYGKETVTICFLTNHEVNPDEVDLRYKDPDEIRRQLMQAAEPSGRIQDMAASNDPEAMRRYWEEIREVKHG